MVFLCFWFEPTRHVQFDPASSIFTLANWKKPALTRMQQPPPGKLSVANLRSGNIALSQDRQRRCDLDL